VRSLSIFDKERERYGLKNNTGIFDQERMRYQVEDSLAKTKDFGPRPAHQTVQQDFSQPEINPGTPDNRNTVQKGLDYIFKENPVSRVLNYVPAKIAEYSVPDSPMIGRREDDSYGNLPGTNARQEHAERNPVLSTGFEKLDKAGDIAGQIGSYFLNPAGPGQGPVALYNAAKNIGSTKLAQKITSPIQSNLGQRIANEAIKEGATAATYAVPHSLIQGDTSAGEIAKNVGIEGALGVAGGAAFSSIGIAGSKLLKRFFGKDKASKQELKNALDDPNTPKQVKEEILLLPEGQKLLSEPKTVRKPKYDSPLNKATDEVLALPEPKLQTKFNAKKTTSPAQRLQQLFNQAKQTDIPPGREREVLEDLWSRMSTYDESVSLDKLIDLASKTQSLKPNMAQLAKQNQNNAVYGVDNLINRLKTNKEGIPTKLEGSPLSFKRERYNPLIPQDAQPFTAKMDPMNKTLAQPIPTKTDGKLLNSLQFGDKIKVRQDRGEVELEFVKREGDTVVVRKRNGKETTVPAQMVVGKAKGLKDTPFDKVQSQTKLKPLSSLENSMNSLKQVKAEPKNVLSNPVELPKRSPKGINERSFFSTVGKSSKMSPELQKLFNQFDKTYTRMPNQEVVDYANRFVKENAEQAYQFVKNAKKFDPRHVTVGHRLIDEFQAKGDFEKALDVVERLAEQGTKAGQSIQAYSLYNRLTPQGQLVRAQRLVSKVNQNFGTEKVKLTKDIADKLTGTTHSIQKLTGQEDVGKNVMNIVDKWNKGQTPTDAETEEIKNFFSDAKKFINDLDPKAKPPQPNKITDARTRDKVISFMDAQEKAARKRLQSTFKRRANSLPVDVFYDLSVIGASKIAKGTVKAADFTEQMVKEYGEEIKPYINQIYNKAVETFNLQSTNLSAKRFTEVGKIVNKATKDKQLTQQEADSIQKYLKDYLTLTGDSKLEASMQLQATLQLLERPTFARKISTLQTIMQLLNPKTMVRNALGNELFYRVEQINKLVATPFDMAKSKVFGSQRTVTFRTNAQGQYWKHWFQGLKAGWKGVNPLGLTTAYDLGPQAFRSKWNPLTYLEKMLGASLRSFDNAGYMRAYNNTLGEMATLKAVNEGLKGKELKEAAQRYMREADVNMMNIADQYGKYATFQDNTTISNALQKAKRGLNKVSTLGATEEFGLGDLILKYPKTPGNLIMRALEYSPAGVVRSVHLINNFRKTKNPLDEREAVISFTRAITGSAGFSLLGYALADKGILTSSGHSDYEVAALERNSGKQPNSVNVSALQRFIASGFALENVESKENDLFVSYDWAQPISMAIALGTGINQSVKEEDQLEPVKAVQKAVDSAVNTIIEQSVLRGLQDFLASYPGRTMSDRVVDAGKGIASSFVPTLSNQIKQIGSNQSRSTYSPDTLQEIKNKAIYRVPGLEKSLPQAYDTLGNPRETYQDGSNSMFNVFFNPAFVRRYKPSPEAKFVLDFINETGEKTTAPRYAKKYITIDGKKVDLTPQQYSDMQRIIGEETTKGLQRVVPKLQGEQDFEKIKKALEKVLNNAGEKARKVIRKQVGE
jgi:hypothetical protein